MALDNKKYERVFSTSGSDADKITSTELSEMKRVFDDNEYINDKGLLQGHGYILYQMQLLTEEIDSLRSEISTNKSKSTFPGFGTSGTTALVGNTTVISSGQASAITANTAKTGISTGQANAITANTAKVSLVGGTGTALSFGEMITTPPPKGSKTSTYSIVMTAVKSGVSKSVTLTLT
jgi:hypothetical protein